MHCQEFEMKKIAIITVFILGSCASSRRTISERPLSDASASGEQVPVQIREVDPSQKSSEYYIKNKELQVKSKRRKNSTGSLTSIEDARSYALPTTLPLTVGMTLPIKVTSNRDESAPQGAAGAAGGAPAGGSSNKLDETLIKALPNLEQAEKGKPVIVKNFNVQVIDIKENGDAVVAYHRRSLRGDQAADLLINAVIPYDALLDRDSISTDRLQSVAIRESQDGELTERVSSNWEDEYTLRISGFDEANSKSALALEDKRKQLQEAKEKVVAQVKSLGSERNTMANERQKLLDEKKASDDKIAAMEEKIKNQESELKDLRPKEEDANKKKPVELVDPAPETTSDTPTEAVPSAKSKQANKEKK
jgi:hypothetical protein